MRKQKENNMEQKTNKNYNRGDKWQRKLWNRKRMQLGNRLKEIPNKKQKILILSRSKMFKKVRTHQNNLLQKRGSLLVVLKRNPTYGQNVSNSMLNETDPQRQKSINCTFRHEGNKERITGNNSQ